MDCIDNLGQTMISFHAMLLVSSVLQLHSVVSLTNVSNADYGEFVPTDEWQVIEEGQAIPPGLHVRVDMQTGLKEAKFMNDDESKVQKKSQTDLAHVSDSSNSDVPINRDLEAAKIRMKVSLEQAMKELQEEEKNKEEKGYISKEELDHAMKNFKKAGEERSPIMENKWRPIEEIKKDFESLNIKMKTDFEVLSDLMEEYKQDNIDTDVHLSILEDLEYLLHQFDNADNFILHNGTNYVLRDLNNTEDTIRQLTLLVIGAASPNNPRVQESMLRNGVIEKLLQMLSSESSDTTKSKILYAIAAVVRNSPYAQKVFFKSGGLQPITDLFKSSRNNRLLLKCITLMSDIISEEYDNSLKNKEQISKSVWHHQLKEYNWCNYVSHLLNSESHDQREKVLVFMIQLHETCRIEFSSTYVEDLLNRYVIEYKHLAKHDEELSTYFSDVLISIEKLRILLMKIRDEL